MPKFVKICLMFVIIALLLTGCARHSAPEEEDDGIFRVVLDAGHGGHDPGAVSGEVYEKDINLAVALLVQQELQGIENVVVDTTRDEDVFVELRDRAEFANDLNADLFVSIHSNALENDDSYSGIFTFYHPDKASDFLPAAIVQKAAANATGAIDRGVRTGDYAVLRETEMDAILVEIGFMTCPEELELLQDPTYQALLSKGIAEGILACR